MDRQNPDAAAQKWAAAMESRRRQPNSKLMPLAPWDEFQYFDAPKTTIVTTGVGGQGIVLCAANPNRIGLIISLCSGSNWFISPTSEPAATHGIQLNGTTTTLLITQDQWGNLVQSAWFGSTTGSATVYVVETILRTFRHDQ